MQEAFKRQSHLGDWMLGQYDHGCGEELVRKAMRGIRTEVDQ